LTIDESMIREATIVVLDRGGDRIGSYGLIGRPPEGRLEYMFLEPDLIGQGYGRLMWNEAIHRAKALGFSQIVIESDCLAEPFYLAMRAERTGLDGVAG